MNYIKRIDDLGRIVIPKEVRRSLCIQNNENMEIIINNDEIILKKHNLLKTKEQEIVKLCKVINNITGNGVILADREKILYSNIDSLNNKELTNDLKEIITNRKIFNNSIKIIENFKINNNYIYKNLIIDSDMTGIVILFGDNINDKDKLLLEIVSKYINTI